MADKAKKLDRLHRVRTLQLSLVQAEEARARAHFDKLSLRQTDVGCVSPGFAIEPEDFLGARHEFVPG